MPNDAIYLYDPSHKYRSLPTDSIEYKKLRIEYLRAYRNAISENNFWMENHYFQKLKTCIVYNNFPQHIEEQLKKVFQQRAEYLSLFLLIFCDNIKDDEELTEEEKIWLFNNQKCAIYTNNKQMFPYEKSLPGLTRRLFKNYQYSGFASEKTIAAYKETTYLFKYSNMEKDMQHCLESKGFRVAIQKTFPDLLSPKGIQLRFDGCIQRDERMLLFECQGIQHYKSIEFFGGQKAFERRQKYDALKKDYCIKNKIPLLCIRYNQNIHKVINKFLSRQDYSKYVYEYA